MRAAQLAFLHAVAAGDVVGACLLAAADRGPPAWPPPISAADIDPALAARTLAALARAGELERRRRPVALGVSAAAETASGATTWAGRTERRSAASAGRRREVERDVDALLGRERREHPRNPFGASPALAAGVAPVPARRALSMWRRA